MSTPSRPIEGMPISADAIARIIENGEINNLNYSPAAYVHKHAGGTVVGKRPTGLDPAPRVRGGSAVTPFLVYDASTPTPAAKVSVYFGQVQSVTPTIGGTPIGDSTPPTLTVVTGVVYLAVIVDGSGVITSASIHNDATIPTADATHGYITLAEVTVVSNAVTDIRQSVTHSLGHQKCGTAVHNFWGV